jgi:hypothetical protein
MPGGARHGSLRRCRSYQASRVPESGILREDETSVRIDGMSTTNPERDISNDSLSLTVPARESERRQGFRAVGVPVSKVAAPIIAKRGGGILARLKAEWAAIVGAEWAAVAWPSALGRDGVLKLRTPATAAVELQHRAPLLIERINLFFGRSVITRLALMQGPIPLDSPSRPRPTATLAAGEVAALDERLSGIADPDLREALGRLGHAVIGSRC